MVLTPWGTPSYLFLPLDLCQVKKENVMKRVVGTSIRKYRKSVGNVGKCTKNMEEM